MCHYCLVKIHLYAGIGPIEGGVHVSKLIVHAVLISGHNGAAKIAVDQFTHFKCLDGLCTNNKD